MSGAWRLLDLQVNPVLLESAAFVEGELGQRDVVIREGLDFTGARGGEVGNKLQDLKAGAFAVLEFLLFGGKGVLGINTRLAGGIDLLEGGSDLSDVIIDVDENVLFELFQLEEDLLERGLAGLVAGARTRVAEGNTHDRAVGIKGVL